MNSGVPTTRPVLVTFWPAWSPPTALAMPKSTTFTVSPPPFFRLNMMLSEEHTSELQSLTNLVCRLLLEKKKKKTIKNRQDDVKQLLSTHPFNLTENLST